MILNCFKIHKIENSHVNSWKLIQQCHLVWKKYWLWGQKSWGWGPGLTLAKLYTFSEFFSVSSYLIGVGKIYLAYFTRWNQLSQILKALGQTLDKLLCKYFYCTCLSVEKHSSMCSYVALYSYYAQYMAHTKTEGAWDKNRV